MLSMDQLPMDDGYLPAGKWLVALRDNLNDSLAGASFKDGLTLEPVNGRLLKRLVTFMPVLGALRVEGDPCALGDVSRLLPAREPEPPAAIKEPERETPAPDSHDVAPASWAELAALDEPRLRALAAEHGFNDLRLRVQRIRKLLADELGIEAPP